MAIVISKKAFEKLFNDAPKLMSLDASNQTVYVVEGVGDGSGEGVMLTIGAGRVVCERDNGETIERSLDGISIYSRAKRISLHANVIMEIIPDD